MAKAAPKPISKVFSAVLTPGGMGLKWVTIKIPFDSAKLWGTRGTLRVKGEINGFAFRSSLFPTGDGHHIMMVNKQMQKGGQAQPGSTARFRMEPDLEDRTAPIPPELQKIFRQSKRLQKFYLSLPPHLRNYMARWIAAAKQPETRIRRAENVAEQWMETIEAEIELPPILRQAFARNPEAARIWQRASPSQRRNALLTIFHYRDFDSRMRRIEKIIANMIEYGGRDRMTDKPELI